MAVVPRQLMPSEMPEAPPRVGGSEPVAVIERRTGWSLMDWRSLWQYRHLAWVLALRDIKVRYKQTVVGALWAVLQPFVTMVVFTVFFTWLGRVPVVEGVPYAVATYCGLLPWLLFANSVAWSTESLVVNQRLVTKVYFPRLLLPVTSIVSALIDFCIAFVILIAMMAWYGIAPTRAVAMLPLFVALAVVNAVGFGCWLSALNAQYRDIRFAVPFALQIGMFVSPVVYQMQAVVPERWQALYCLNPMAGILEGFRWALLGQAPPPPAPVLLSLGLAVLIGLSGIVYFRHVERTIADRV